MAKDASTQSAKPKPPPPKTSAEIRAEIEQTRTQLAAQVDALVAKGDPKKVVAGAKAKANAKADEAKAVVSKSAKDPRGAAKDMRSGFMALPRERQIVVVAGTALVVLVVGRMLFGRRG
jgi:hypothetical protein